MAEDIKKRVKRQEAEEVQPAPADADDDNGEAAGPPRAQRPLRRKRYFYLLSLEEIKDYIRDWGAQYKVLIKKINKAVKKHKESIGREDYDGKYILALNFQKAAYGKQDLVFQIGKFLSQELKRESVHLGKKNPSQFPHLQFSTLEYISVQINYLENKYSDYLDNAFRVLAADADLNGD